MFGMPQRAGESGCGTSVAWSGYGLTARLCASRKVEVVAHASLGLTENSERTWASRDSEPSPVLPERCFTASCTKELSCRGGGNGAAVADTCG